MNKTMNKIVVKCILTVCIIFVPFILANYFVVNYAIQHGEFFHEYDEMILNILQTILIFAAGIIVKNKSKDVITESDASKKYVLSSLIAFLAIALLCITGIYPDIYGSITESLQIFDKAPLFLAVCWEQILNGKFLLALSLCIAICFVGKITNPKESLA